MVQVLVPLWQVIKFFKSNSEGALVVWGFEKSVPQLLMDMQTVRWFAVDPVGGHSDRIKVLQSTGYQLGPSRAFKQSEARQLPVCLAAQDKKTASWKVLG